MLDYESRRTVTIARTMRTAAVKMVLNIGDLCNEIPSSPVSALSKMGQRAGEIVRSGGSLRLRACAFQIANARQGALAEGLGAGAPRISGRGRAALTQPEAITVHLKDVHVVGKAVEDGAGQAL